MTTRDETLVSAAYGPEMSFAAELGSDGSFVFALAGNVLPKFPLCEIGRWVGSDPARVSHLRQAIAAAMAAATDNASKLPDSAYLFVQHGGDKPVKRMFALYDPPAEWAPVQEDLLRSVHQAWVAARERTVAATARWHDDAVSAGTDPIVLVELTHTGREPLELEDSGTFLLSLGRLDRAADPASSSRRELGEDELTIEAPPSAGAKVALEPGAVHPIRVTIRRRLAPGAYRLRLEHTIALLAEGFRRGGTFTLDLPALTVQP